MLSHGMELNALTMSRDTVSVMPSLEIMSSVSARTRLTASIV